MLSGDDGGRRQGMDGCRLCPGGTQPDGGRIHFTDGLSYIYDKPFGGSVLANGCQRNIGRRATKVPSTVELFGRNAHEKLFKTQGRRTSAKRNVASGHPKEAKNSFIIHPCFNGRCSCWVDFLRHVGQPGWGTCGLHWVGVSNVLFLWVSVAGFIPIHLVLSWSVAMHHIAYVRRDVLRKCLGTAIALPHLGCRRMVDQCLIEIFQLLPKVAQLLWAIVIDRQRKQCARAILTCPRLVMRSCRR